MDVDRWAKDRLAVSQGRKEDGERNHVVGANSSIKRQRLRKRKGER